MELYWRAGFQHADSGGNSEDVRPHRKRSSRPLEKDLTEVFTGKQEVKDEAEQRIL